MTFQYGNKEIEYLKSKDKHLSEMIERIGLIARPMDDDLGIQRGLRMIYHHHKIDRNLFEKYRKRFSPYGSVASLYVWAVAGGAIPEMIDYKTRH